MGGLGDGGTNRKESGSGGGETHLERRDGERAVQRADKRSSEVVNKDEVTDSRLCGLALLAIVLDGERRRTRHTLLVVRW